MFCYILTLLIMYSGDDETHVKILAHVVEDISLKNDLLPSDDGIWQVETHKERTECLELKQTNCLKIY